MDGVLLPVEPALSKEEQAANEWWEVLDTENKMKVMMNIGAELLLVLHDRVIVTGSVDDFAQNA
jgi:hypothetical protein